MSIMKENYQYLTRSSPVVFLYRRLNLENHPFEALKFSDLLARTAAALISFSPFIYRFFIFS